MSDYDDDRSRWRNRNFDEDFDYEGGYGRQFDENRGYYGRGMDYDRGSYGPYSGRQGQYRGPMNRSSGQEWDYGRGTYDYYRGNYGRGMDYDRDYSNQDYNRYSQNRGRFNRGYSGQSTLGRRGYNQGYGYNRGFNQMDWDRDYDFDDFDTDFEPADFTYMEFWMIPGPETGRGPQGYQRSDERILEDVCDRLMQHGQVDASDMTVEVQNHEVTLNGTVNSRKAKRMAEDMVESVPGVTNVHNQLKVHQEKRHGQRQAEQTQEQQKTS